LRRLAVLAAALLCGAAAPVPETKAGSGEFRSAVERHWLAYAELRRQKELRPQ
jgi:hypothetical protein